MNEGGDESTNKSMDRFINNFIWILDAPATWFREKVVEPNRPKYPYYHRQFRRIPTVDECEYNDITCQFEADQQLYRDKQVDSKILYLLRKRHETCRLQERPDDEKRCAKLLKDYDDAAENWFIKYGDMGPQLSSRACYMKQKHRMVWERRQAAKEEKELES